MKKLWELAKKLSVIVFFAFLIWFLYKTTINEGKGFFIMVFGLTCLYLVLDILGAAYSALYGKHYESAIGSLLENKNVVMSPWFHAAFAAVFVLGIISLFVISGARINAAYDNGHDDGYSSGYEDGKDMQYEIDCEKMLWDGKSVNDIVGDVYAAYGITPCEAANIVDNYLSEPGHDGITKKQYELARDALCMTGWEIDE